MKKIVCAIVALSFVALVPISLFADFDKKAVDAAMHVNASTMTALGKAVDAADYWAAAQSFYTLMSNNRPLVMMDPPKGDKTEWQADLRDLIEAAYQGLGASLAKDSDGVKKALASLKAAQGKGHKEFRG